MRLPCGWPVTLSVGAITYDHPPGSVDSMVKRADDLMYAVKKRGKNGLEHDRWPAGSRDRPE